MRDHDAFADDAWIMALVDFVRRALENGRVRIVGVCFGHQIPLSCRDADEEKRRRKRTRKRRRRKRWRARWPSRRR